MNHVEKLQGLLGSVGFPETPEERDEAERAIMAFSDSVGELLAVKRISFDRKLDELRSLKLPSDISEPSDGMILSEALILQGEIQEISTTIMQLEEVLGMEKDGSRPFGFKRYMEYMAQKEGQ